MKQTKHEAGFINGPWVISNKGKPLFGEWSIRQDPSDRDGQGYQHIAIVPANKKGTWYGDAFHATARLIAESPSMFSIIQELAKVCCNCDDGCIHDRAREIESKVRLNPQCSGDHRRR